MAVKPATINAGQLGAKLAQAAASSAGTIAAAQDAAARLAAGQSAAQGVPTPPGQPQAPQQATTPAGGGR